MAEPAFLRAQRTLMVLVGGAAVIAGLGLTVNVARHSAGAAVLGPNGLWKTPVEVFTSSLPPQHADQFPSEFLVALHSSQS